MTKFSAIFGALLTTTCLTSTAAFGQVEPSGSAEQRSDLGPAGENEAKPEDQAVDEIIVTAEKRAEGRSVQRVPLSVVAVGPDTIARNQLSNVAEVAKIAANVAFVGSSANSFPNFFIRGLGVTGTVRTIDPAVGLFVDGVYVGFGPSALVDNFDIASIEVLRGPQGTLFGRNVSAGAIIVNTKRPGSVFAVDTRATIQTHGVYDAAVGVDIPLGANVYSRLVGVYSHEDGYFHDRVNDKDDARKNLILLRPSIRFAPSDDLTIDLIGEYQRNRGGAAVAQFLARPGAPDAQANIGPFSLRGSVGYLDTDYKSYDDPGIAARGKTFDQLRLERSPKWTFSINPSYTVAIGRDLEARASINYSYTGSYFNDTYNTFYLKEKSHGILDASLSLSNGSRWELIGFVKNITNEDYTEFRAEVATLTTAAFGGIPRRFGVQLKNRF